MPTNMTSKDNSSHQWLMDSAVYLSDYLAIYHSITSIVGIALNVTVAGAIISWSRLHMQRNIMWLGVGFSNLLLLIFHLAEVLAVYWPISPVAADICAFISGLPNPALTLSGFINLVERRLCLRQPSWHKRYVTNGLIVSVQVLCFAVLCLAIKGRYIFGAAPLRWPMSSWDFNLIVSFVVAGVILCLVGEISVWTLSRQIYPPVVVEFIAMNSLSSCESGDQQAEDGADNSSPRSNDNPFVCIGNERVSRKDLEAARSVTIGFGSLLGLSVPTLISLGFLAGCLNLSTDETTKDCSQWASFFFHARVLIALHVFISPVIFVLLSRDFRSALRDRGFPFIS